MLAQLAALPVPADEPALDAEVQPAGAEGPASSTPNRKVIVDSAEELLERVRQGYQYLEIAAHLDMSHTSAVPQDFLLVSSGNLFMKVLMLALFVLFGR